MKTGKCYLNPNGRFALNLSEMFMTSCPGGRLPKFALTSSFKIIGTFDHLDNTAANLNRTALWGCQREKD